MSARSATARRGSVPAGVRTAVALAVVVPSAMIGVAWLVGQVALDRWTWSQWLFWFPACAVAGTSFAGALAAWRLLGPSLARRAALGVLVVASVLAAARSARHDFGWAWSSGPSAGSIVVTHWNPQWPGDQSLEAGRALAGVLGDVAVITGPGSMLRASVRGDWLPDGVQARDFGAFGIVSRLAILDARILASASPAGIGSIWLAWFEVRAATGERIRILAVDLPSQPRLARGRVAAALAELRATVRLPASPDIVLGDLNATPGSVVEGVLSAEHRSAPPWRASGWLCTYRRPWAFFRIDAMHAGPRLEWDSYRTVDLGISEHRAQVGSFRVSSDGDRRE